MEWKIAGKGINWESIVLSPLVVHNENRMNIVASIQDILGTIQEDHSVKGQ